MKTTFPLLIALLALLHCALAPACAFAVTGQELATLRGERSYPQALDLPDAQTFAAEPGALLLSGSQAALQPDAEKLEALTAQLRGQITDLGDAVDFLSVFADDCVGALVNRANHLQSLYTLTEDELSASDRDTLGAFIADYSLLASQLFSQIEFQLTKLSYAHSRTDIDVRVHAAGFRTQASGKLYVQGGGFTVMSLEPDDGSPHIIQTTYNDEDIVRVANGIYITPYNHALQSLSFCANTASAACHVQLYQPGSSAQPGGKENVIAEFDVDPSRPSADLRQDDTYATEYSRTFSAEYGSDAYFQRNQPVYLRLTWQQGGEQRKTEALTLFSVKKARVPNPTFVNDTNQFMGSIGFTLPKDWPIIDGSRLALPTNTVLHLKARI